MLISRTASIIELDPSPEPVLRQNRCRTRSILEGPQIPSARRTRLPSARCHPRLRVVGRKAGFWARLSNHGLGRRRRRGCTEAARSQALVGQCQLRRVRIRDTPLRTRRTVQSSLQSFFHSTTPSSLPARRRPPAKSIGRRPVTHTLTLAKTINNSSPIPPSSYRARAARTP
jgi:hypothetical protein